MGVSRVLRSFLRGILLFCGAALLRKVGLFDRFPGLQWRGRVHIPGTPRTVNHSGGRITSTTDRVGPVSRNSRTRRTSVDLWGPLRYVIGRSR